MRFSVAMPEDLLMRFDALVAKRGLAKNRSEVVRDLVREALAEEDCTLPGEEARVRMPSSSFCAGTLPISFSTVSCGTASMLLLRSDVRLRAPYRSRRLCDTDGSGELAHAGGSIR